MINNKIDRWIDRLIDGGREREIEMDGWRERERVGWMID